jgi:hypothetical protein
MLRALVVLLALSLALPMGAGPAPPAARVKNTNGWIESIGMDGSRVAYAVHGVSCTKVFTWDVPNRGGARVSGRQTCAADSTSTGGGVTEIAVAGRRVGWIVNQGGNTESDDHLYVGSLRGSPERLVGGSWRTGAVGGVLTGRWLGGLVGDGDLLAFNAWRTDEEGNVVAATLRRVGRPRLKTLSSGLQAYRAAAADRGRIAVARGDGTVALYAGAGRLLRAIVPSSVREVALQGGDLVVLTRSRTIEVYSAATGKRRATWPVKAAAAQLDIASGQAVYAVWRTVHLLRLADGKDVQLTVARRAVEGLEIEAPGIAYAYNTVKRGREVGNLAFVPMAKATPLLG